MFCLLRPGWTSRVSSASKKASDELIVQVRGRGCLPSDVTDEQLRKVFKDVPEMLLKLLQRKKTPEELFLKGNEELQLPESGV